MLKPIDESDMIPKYEKLHKLVLPEGLSSIWLISYVFPVRDNTITFIPSCFEIIDT